ncbi:VirB4 family type IV secretion/conjugal transfer ATPase [Roseicella aquatilis]|uniref:CagE TrbE VirB component of type IV transporter system central domain-containing protein n=1 Tax=Roseicella aquatilis TaxID=2527868 RepID=A0A4R4DKH7_9PROT|nr:hypothetical protein [Roseicella aquatilis]TCZ61129.1 hypothetical protein EXY23_13450 [Roseicella aquatilis]
MGIDRRFLDVPADEFLPLLWHVTDHVVQYADGSLGTTFCMPGRPLGLMDLDGRYAARRQRHAGYRALFDPNTTIYEHHVCHDVVPPFAPGPTRSAYARELLADYHEALGEGLLTREWFVTVIVRPRGLAGTLAAAQAMIGLATTQVDEALLQQLEEKAATLLSTMRDYSPRRLGRVWRGGVAFSEVAEAYRTILYGRWSPAPEPRGMLAGAVYTDRVVAGLLGFEVQRPEGNGLGVIYGVRDYPERLIPTVLDGLLAARCRLVVTSRFSCTPAAVVQLRMSRKQTQMENARSASVTMHQDMQETKDDLESGRTVTGDHHWSLALHADSEAELRRAAGEIRGILANTSNLNTTPEGLGVFAAYWAQVPGSPGFLRARHGGVTAYNHLSLSSGIGYPRGKEKPYWGRALIRLVTEGGTAHDFDLHVEQVAQALMLGPPGFGKSTFLGLLAVALEQVIAPKGGLVAILDRDGSNRLTVLVSGGYYARIRRGVASGMAPLKADLPDTDMVRSWLAEWVASLIMADGKGPPPPHQVEQIAFAVRFLVRRPAAMRSLAGLRQFLDHGEDSTGARLERWCRGGSLGWAFDGDEDLVRLEAGIVGIDNTELLTDDMALVRQPAAAYQFFRLRERIGRGIRGAVIVDEGASYMPEERYAAGFDAFSRDLRKGNGAFILAAHHPQDLEATAAGRTLLNNTPTKLLFGNPFADAGKYRDLLHCTPGEIDVVLERMVAMGPGTVLIKRPEGSFVARPPLERLPQHVAILSANANRNRLWDEIAHGLGTTDPEAIWPVYRRRHEEAAA